jgi:hypothetical protein
MLIITTPMAILDAETNPMAASLYKLVFSLSLLIKIDAKMTSGIEANNGDSPKNNEIETVAKQTCERPSLINDCFLNTRKFPSKEAAADINIPHIKAL